MGNQAIPVSGVPNVGATETGCATGSVNTSNDALSSVAIGQLVDDNGVTVVSKFLRNGAPDAA